MSYNKVTTLTYFSIISYKGTYAVAGKASKLGDKNGLGKALFSS